ncbi:MAG: insulinase family protein, partial [Desulfobulbaceae bacterium]|nr:insulinase family protein [Desulfobulbaceae bacterium]
VRANYRPDRLVISAAGNVDHQIFVDLWQDRVGGIPPAATTAPRRKPPQPGNVSARQIINRPLEQAHLIMGSIGLPNNSADRYKLLLLNTILGGNMSSRLFQEIREKRGLAYSIFSYLSSNSDCGYTAIYMGVDPKFLSESVGLIEEELGKLRMAGVTKSELAGAIEYANSGIYLAAENMEVRMTSLAKNEFSFGRYLAIEELTGAISAVNVEGVNELAQKLFADDTLPLCVIGPVSEI